MDNGHWKECAVAGVEHSKYEYGKSSVRRHDFPFKRLKDCARTRDSSVLRAASQGTATGWLCILYCFAQCYLRKCAEDPFFPAKVLFFVKGSFAREEICNTHNAYVRAEENPHVIRRRAAHIRFSVNVCECFIGDHLIWPYLLLFPLTGCNYMLLMKQILPL